jgi:hypothetical protein
MIKHVVLLSFAANVSEEKINNALEKLGSLRQKEIPQIKSFSFGKDISPEDQSNGFNYAFIMDFANEADRDVYLTHKQHTEVANKDVLPLLADGFNSVAVVDYKV